MLRSLDLSFYRQENVVEIAQNLLGKYLMTDINHEGITGGIIVETEAYAGAIDKASHAYGQRRTERTKVMYKEGGIAYVYLIYGFHYLFNVVTNIEEVPHAILIRAIEPIEGIDIMLQRRNLDSISRRLTSGPGLLTKALGINKMQNGISLIGKEVWIEDRGYSISKEMIESRPRVNVDYADEDALLLYRFSIKGNKWVSKG